MARAKDIVVRPIGVHQAREVIRRVHYSGTVTMNSALNLGVFVSGKLEGAMQFGPPLDRRKMLPLVRGTEWNQMLELNRLAFSDALPRNSESRALAVAFRMMRKHRPDIKWILSFSDATQCGDGTIYRAAGFVLTAIKRSTGVFRLPDGTVVQRMSLEPTGCTTIQRKLREQTGLYSCSAARLVAAAGGVAIPGYQLRYVYFLDRTWADRLAVPIIPFSAIPDDVRMVRGHKRQPVGGSGVQPVDRPCESDPDAPFFGAE